jgi:ATP dependent DNA ligase domain
MPKVRPRSAFVAPCIPTRALKPPAGPEWVHEIKHDGYRLQVRRDGDVVRLFTRKGYDWSDRYPAIAAIEHEIFSVEFNRPCPVCDGVMELSSIDAESWSLRTMGERRKFCCASCGITQSEWSVISVAAPSTAPD